MSRTVVHDTFVIDRSYPASPARVFTAFADPATKKQWWGDADIEQNAPHVIDFRVGGRETMAGDDARWRRRRSPTTRCTRTSSRTRASSTPTR